jgi:hypothetical protein
MMFPLTRKEKAFSMFVMAVNELALLDPVEIEEIATSLEHPEISGNSRTDDEAFRAIAGIVRTHGGKMEFWGEVA